MCEENAKPSELLNLSDIIQSEYLKTKCNLPEDLKNAAILLFHYKDIYVTVSNAFKENNCETVEDLMKKWPTRYCRYFQTLKKKKSDDIIFDLFLDCYLQKDDKKFGLFLAYKITQIELTDLDDFLDIILVELYDCDMTSFARKLNLSIREFSDSILADKKITDTIFEWIEMRKNLICKNIDYSNFNIQWSTDDVDFIKLIYSLYYAGFINNGIGEVTTITNELANIFKVKYDKKSNALTQFLSSALEKNRNVLNFHNNLIKGFDLYLKKEHPDKNYRKVT